MNEEIKKSVNETKNICLIPSENEPESLPAALALFYTLKELNKNVNVLIEEFPEKLGFLMPSLDFISQPKNFVISIPRSLADVSQVYYEKNEDQLKIHLTLDHGQIKKEHLSCYFSEPKPDLVITLGIQDWQEQLTNRLDSFGFILDVPILNIDNQQTNKLFGTINLVKDCSLSEIVRDVIESIDESLLKKNAANDLLTGLMMYYENFKSKKTSPEVFQLTGDLIKKGAEYQQIMSSLYKTTDEEIIFLSAVFQNLKISDAKVSYAVIDSNDFQSFAALEANAAIEKMKTIGIQNDLLVLWKSHASNPTIKGFFYSKKPDLINKIAEMHQKPVKNDWIFLSMPGSDIHGVKDNLLAQLTPA